MKKLLTLLSLGALAASTASAVVLVETFDYGLVNGTTIVGTSANNTEGGVGGWMKNVSAGVAVSTTSLDGTGSAMFVDRDIAYRAHGALSESVGAVSTFSFLLNVPANTSTTTNANGARIMFESAGSSSNYGYGVNFDQPANSGNIVFYNRVGTSNNTSSPVSVAPGTDLLVQGTFTRTGQYAGSLTMSYYSGAGFTNLVGTQTTLAGSWATPSGNPAPTIVVRVGGVDGGYTIDNITIVPEPSTYAAILGLGALGFAMYRRRQK